MSIWVSFGLVGFGASGGLFPEIRLGIVSAGCCRGAIGARVQVFRKAMLELLDKLDTRR